MGEGYPEGSRPPRDHAKVLAGVAIAVIVLAVIGMALTIIGMTITANG